MNHRGDFASIVYVVIFLVAAGVILLLTNGLNQAVFKELDVQLNTSEYINTTAVDTLHSIKNTDQSAWDYAFLGIFFGVILALGLTSWMIRVSPIFFWVYVLLSLSVLVLGVALSNMWQDFAADPSFSETISHFPITNMILGSYYPVIVLGLIAIALLFIFGKPPEANSI